MYVSNRLAMAAAIKIDQDLRDRVQRLASLRQRSAGSILREAVVQYVAREEARESFGQDARAAWDTYRTTSNHLDGQEISAWLDNWGTEAEAELPECHA